jgi:hypothetical protein
MTGSVNFTSRCLYPRGKFPWFPLDRRMGGPQSRSGCSWLVPFFRYFRLLRFISCFIHSKPRLLTLSACLVLSVEINCEQDNIRVAAGLVGPVRFFQCVSTCWLKLNLAFLKQEALVSPARAFLPKASPPQSPHLHTVQVWRVCPGV